MSNTIYTKVPEHYALDKRANQQFKYKAPAAFEALINTSDPDDPLLKQILPIAQENEVIVGYNNDPVGDLSSRKAPGVIHKYRNRVLLTVTGACSIHCRYCFRRHFPYNDNQLSELNLKRALNYIQSNTNINEVILSGGDPLSLSDNKLNTIISSLENIEHLVTLRIHSRTLTVNPERITDALQQMLSQTRLQIVIVTHVNHENELSHNVLTGLAKLKPIVAQLLNQSVLLHGINDDVETLQLLSLKLFEGGVLPYYLHLMDKVQGAAHFDVPLDKAKNIHQTLQKTLAGYLVPKLVYEKAGVEHKIML